MSLKLKHISDYGKDADNPIYNIEVVNKFINWETDTSFNKGTFTDTEVSGIVVDAFIQLEKLANNNNNITYDNVNNYTLSNSGEITVDQNNNNLAKLKLFTTSSNNWPFTDAGNYAFSASEIEVISGQVQLIGASISLLGWWHLNESSGTNAPDSSGNGNDATLVNTEDADWVAGKLNNAVSLDGTNEYINAGNISSFDVDDPFSVELWYYENSSLGRSLVSKRTGVTGWLITTRSDQKIQVYLGDSSGVLRSRTVSTFSPATWRHLVVTYDGSNTFAGIKIYINGSLQSVADFSTSTPVSLINAANLEIGSYDGGAASWNGIVDEVLVYEEVINQTYITARYNSGTGTETLPNQFALTNPTIIPNTGFAFTSNLALFTETATKPSGADLKYQISSNDGTTWEWWNGSTWIAISNGDEIASAVTTVAGTYVSGNLASIQTLDANLYIVNEITGSAPNLSVEIDFNSLKGPSDNINFWGYYDGNPAHTVNVEIWNYTTSVWDSKGTLPDTGTTVIEYNYTITGTKTDYISGTNAKIRIYHVSTGSTGHSLAIDYIKLETTPTNTWYYNNEANSASTINTNIDALASSGTFSFKSFLHSDVGIVTPQLDNIYISEEESYSTTDNLYIDTKNTVQIAPTTIFSWLTTTITNVLPTNTDIKILFSTDSRINWLTWDGGIWSTPTNATLRIYATSLIDATTNFSSLPLGDGTLDIRLFLYSSDSSVSPEVSNINITSNQGYSLTGEYESNIYDSTYQSLIWGVINYLIINETGTTVTITARASNNNSVMGDYSFPFTNNQVTNLSGKYIQWKAVFTSTGPNTGKIDNLGFYFTSPSVQEVAP